MKKVLIFLLVVGILLIGTVSVIEEISEHPLTQQGEYSDESSEDTTPCGGGGGSGDGGVPG